MRLAAASVTRSSRLSTSRSAGAPSHLHVDASGSSCCRPGAGTRPRCRLVCELRSALGAALTPSTEISFADHSFPERIGWREIVVAGDGVTIGAGAGWPLPAASGASDRLNAYPTSLIAQPLAVAAVAFRSHPRRPGRGGVRRP